MPFDPQIPSGHEALGARWLHFGAFVEELESEVTARSAGDRLDITALDGKRIGGIDGGDVQFKFANITWSLTTADSHNGGVGAVSSAFKKAGKPATWTRGSAVFHVDGFAGYADLDDAGLRYLALHETSHVTLLELQIQDACWKTYLKGGGDPNDYARTDPWTFNEQVANLITRTVAGWIGLPVIEAPTFGFPPTLAKIGLKVT